MADNSDLEQQTDRETPDFSSIEAIIAQQAPGKQGEEASQAMGAALEAMDNSQLLDLVESAFKEDPEANSLVIQKASEILTQRGADQPLKERIRETRSADWRSLLGEFIGTKLYDAIAPHIDEKQLLEYGQQAIDAALEEGIKQIASLGPDADTKSALQQIAQVLAGKAEKLGDEWLKSEGGQKLLSSISHWVDDNPGYIVLAAILAAAGAVAADLDIPAIKQKFSIGESFSGNVEADLGSLRNIALEAAKLDLQYVSGKFTAKAGVDYNKEDGASGSASLRYGTEEDFIQTTGSIDPDGNLLIDLDAAFKEGIFAGKFGINHDSKNDATTGSIDLSAGNEHVQTNGNVTLHDDGHITASLDAKQVGDLINSQAGIAYDGSKDQTTANAQTRIGEGPNFLQAQGNATSGPEGFAWDSQLSGGFKLGNDNNFLQGNGNYGLGSEGSRYGAGLNGQFMLGDKDRYLKGLGEYSLGSERDDAYKLGLEGGLRLDPNSMLRAGASFEDDKLGGFLSQQYTDENLKFQRDYLFGDENTFKQSLDYTGENFNFGLNATDKGMDGKIDEVSAELGLQPSELVNIILKYGRDASGNTTASAEASYTGENFQATGTYEMGANGQRVGGNSKYTNGNWNAELGAMYNITDAQLEEVSVKLGFRDPEEFKAFSVEFSRKAEGDVSTIELKTMFEAELGKFMIRGTAAASLVNNPAFDNPNLNLDMSLLGAYQIGDSDFSAIAGASAQYNSMTGNTNIIPQVGIQYKKIPVTVGYDFQDKGFRIGVTIPFGR